MITFPPGLARPDQTRDWANSLASVVAQAGLTHVANAEGGLVRRASNTLPPETVARSYMYCSGEPCGMCSCAAYWVGIPRLIYGSPGSFIAELAACTGFRDKEHPLAGGAPAVSAEAVLVGSNALGIERCVEGWIWFGVFRLLVLLRRSSNSRKLQQLSRRHNLADAAPNERSERVRGQHPIQRARTGNNCGERCGHKRP